MNWSYDPTQYDAEKEYDFTLIPKGNHRARIEKVEEKTFNSGNEGFEIILEISGYASRVWYYLVLNKENTQSTNQRIGEFLNCFGILNADLSKYKTWESCCGAVRIKHEEYNGEPQAKVSYLLSKNKQLELPPWGVNEGDIKPIKEEEPIF